MAEGKWIPGLSATMPAVDAARRTLRIRLEVINHHLIGALRHPEKDPEFVHQLRVGVRRAAAALDIFAPLLPEKNYDSAFKKLRELRRSAGRARDWDVFLLAMAEQEAAPGIDFLIGYGVSRRLRAQNRLAATGTTYAQEAEGFADDLIMSLRGDDTQTLHALGRPILLDQLEQFRQAVGRDLNDYEQLHRVRIVGKRLRYAMELFADCFEPQFREQLYPRIEAMQEILGRANDSHVASQLLAELRTRLRTFSSWPRYRPDFERLIRFHRRRLPTERRRFLRWWEQWQQDHIDCEFAKLLEQPVIERK
ncbi:MAG: CHAD domain-containing protein [Gemmataceae bacterium]